MKIVEFVFRNGESVLVLENDLEKALKKAMSYISTTKDSKGGVDRILLVADSEYEGETDKVLLADKVVTREKFNEVVNCYEEKNIEMVRALMDVYKKLVQIDRNGIVDCGDEIYKCESALRLSVREIKIIKGERESES